MPPSPTDPVPSSRLLSRREREVLALLAGGLTDKEVAARLGVAAGTVREYRKRMESKLGVRGTPLCMLVAWRLGEVDLDAISEAALAARWAHRGLPSSADPDEEGRS